MSSGGREIIQVLTQIDNHNGNESISGAGEPVIRNPDFISKGRVVFLVQIMLQLRSKRLRRS